MARGDFLGTNLGPEGSRALGVDCGWWQRAVRAVGGNFRVVSLGRVGGCAERCRDVALGVVGCRGVARSGAWRCGELRQNVF